MGRGGKELRKGRSTKRSFSLVRALESKDSDRGNFMNEKREEKKKTSETGDSKRKKT